MRPLNDLSPEGPDVTVEGDDVLLVGSRSASSGVEAFPARPICPETGARDMALARFGPRATLYSYSTIHVSAVRETPYTLGYVDFPGGLRALAHVRVPHDELRCDLPVVLRADGEAWWVEADAKADGDAS